MNESYVFNERIGYEDLHQDTNINFQLNRWLPFVPEQKMRQIADEIIGFGNFKNVALKHAEQAEADGQTLTAAYLYRAAEFTATVGDPDKAQSYSKFLQLFNELTKDDGYKRYEVPFDDGALPVIYLEPVGKIQETLVVHGGFDSFIEELYADLSKLAQYGIRVIVFEGPGQGNALNKHKLVMTSDWHECVAAILDYFSIKDCTLMGLSLGGCLVTRAAAKEPRVKRVIANDVMEDFFDVITSRMGEKKAPIINFLMKHKMKRLINRLFTKAIAKDETLHWAMAHAFHVSGASTPYEYLCWAKTLTTKDISHLLTQDFLLMAGADDHFVPIEQFYNQQKTLTNVRSLTARIFTHHEQASNHCHVGNVRLSVIADWILQYKQMSRA